LQPIGKYQEAYEGTSFDVLVYAVTPIKERVGIAIIKNLFVPLAKERENAIRVMQKRGWIKEMSADLGNVGIPTAKLGQLAINVRFFPSDVVFFDSPIAVPRSHKLYRINRYQPIDWDDDFPNNIRKSMVTRSQRGGKPRSEHERKRAAIDGIEYSPQHVRLQNKLYDYLCALHGEDAISYEESFVDLKLEEPDGTTYFEIKIAPTAKSCIRQAMGQLIEYAMYPDQQRAKKLVVVGDGEATSDDLGYLSHLRKKFGLPIYYQRWEAQSKTLGGEC
jgi:hypothetical protein